MGAYDLHSCWPISLVLAFPAADLRRDARLPEQRARLCKTFGGAWRRTASGLQAGALTAPRSLQAIKPAASTAGAAAGGPEQTHEPHPNVYTTPQPFLRWDEQPARLLRCVARPRRSYVASTCSERQNACLSSSQCSAGASACRHCTKRPSTPSGCGGAGMAESEQTFYYNESRAITWDAVGNATRARWFVAAEV